MSTQEKQDKKRQNRTHSRNRSKSAGKKRKPLTSRDVYYLVVKYEQELLVKKAIENQVRIDSKRSAKMEEEIRKYLSLYFTNKQTNFQKQQNYKERRISSKRHSELTIELVIIHGNFFNSIVNS